MSYLSPAISGLHKIISCYSINKVYKLGMKGNRADELNRGGIESYRYFRNMHSKFNNNQKFLLCLFNF